MLWCGVLLLPRLSIDVFVPQVHIPCYYYFWTSGFSICTEMSYIIECPMSNDGSKACLIPNPGPSRQPIHIKKTQLTQQLMLWTSLMIFLLQKSREINQILHKLMVFRVECNHVNTNLSVTTTCQYL